MKRRDFVYTSSLSLAALAASDQWLQSVLAGAPNKTTPILETYFHLGKAEIDKLLLAALAKGAEFADVFFEYRVTSSLSFEEDQVKSARRGIVPGVGIRAIKGDQVGFAFSEELTIPTMLEAAVSAAAIAADKAAKVKSIRVTDLKTKNLYPTLNSPRPLTSTKS